jgi:histidyl-tRNA synthetase
VDVELITLALGVLSALGLKDVRLSLSHTGLIRALLAGSGLSPKEQASMFDRILDGDRAALASLAAQLSAPGDSLRPLLDLKGKSPGFLRNIKALLSRELPDFEPALDDFIEIVSLLDTLGHTFEIDIASGKGFEYYTGIMFQIFAGEERVAGGGRYDDLIPLMGGPAVPASGFALYVDSLMGLISPQMLNDHLPERVLVRNEAGQRDAMREAFRMASLLREAGYAAELHLGGALPTSPRWMLDVRSQAPRFVLTDGTSGARREAMTAEEIISLLGGGVDR